MATSFQTTSTKAEVRIPFNPWLLPTLLLVCKRRSEDTYRPILSGGRRWPKLVHHQTFNYSQGPLSTVYREVLAGFFGSALQ
jgi:hypothetical protein